ncbi:MAG: DUF4350 domain-containing protein [Pyrinomonadaceae bacterium]
MGCSYCSTPLRNVSKSSSASDSELNPDRSSYHEGSTGTKGLYEFLQESDYRAVRWRKSLVALMDTGASRPQVLLIVGPIKIPLEQKESAALASWVAEGGRFVVVDREACGRAQGDACRLGPHVAFAANSKLFA